MFRVLIDNYNWDQIFYKESETVHEGDSKVVVWHSLWANKQRIMLNDLDPQKTYTIFEIILEFVISS